MSKGAMGE